MAFENIIKDSGLLALKESIPDSDDSIRVVGGAVRDFMHGQQPVSSIDIDLSTTYKPEEIQGFLSKSFIPFKTYALKFGTIVAIINSKAYEITSCRKDIETDGRWAKVEYTKDWLQDAMRRDFTFNAMYLSLSGQLFDFFGGKSDLHKGIVRFIGDPKQRLAEDHLRLLRYYRFWGKFSKQDTDKELRQVFADLVPGIVNLSADRIRHELLLIASTPYNKFVAIINDLIEIGFFQHVLKCQPRWPYDNNLEHMSPLGRLFALYMKDIDILCQSLNFSKKDRTYMHLMYDGYEKNFQKNAMLAAYGYDVCKDLLAMKGDGDVFLPPYSSSFPLKASDLIKHGISGPEISKKIRITKEFWLSNNCEPDARSCLLFKNLMAYIFLSK
jgi:poly(A) polymerase